MKHISLLCNHQQLAIHPPCSGTCDGHGTEIICEEPCSCLCHAYFEPQDTDLSAFNMKNVVIAYDPTTGEWYMSENILQHAPRPISIASVVTLYEWLRERLT